MPSAPMAEPNSQELLSTFVRQMPVAVAMFDRQMRYLQASDRWCADYGLDPANLAGRRHYDVFPNLPREWKEAHQRGLSGETLDGETARFESQGREMWVKWEIRPWGSSHGLPAGILVYTEDVTKRQQAEQALLERQSQLTFLNDLAARLWGAPDLRTGLNQILSGAIDLLKSDMGSIQIFDPERRVLHLEVQHGLPDVFLETFKEVAAGDRTACARALRDGKRTIIEDVETDESLTPFLSVFRAAGCRAAQSTPLIASDGMLLGMISNHFRSPHRPTEAELSRLDLYARLAVAFIERHSAEQERAAVSQQYRDLVDNSPDGIARLDLEGRYVFVNQRMADMGHARVEDFPGRLVGSLATKSTDYWLAAVRRVIATRHPETLQYPAPGETSSVAASLRLVPELLPGGEVRSVLLIAADVTELKRSEATARERESMIAALFETASQAIFAIDANGKIQLVNRMAEEQFGYGRDELLGRDHEILLPEAFREKHEALRQSYALNPARRPMGGGMELEARRKDGSLFPVEVSLSPMMTDHGSLAVAFVSDITQRKQQEAALHELRGALLTAEEDAARKIARELHDDITQRLSFLSIEIGRAAAKLPEAGPLLPELRSFQAKILETTEAIRQISHELHPSILDDLGLGAAIESLCLDLERSGARVHFASRHLPAKINPAVASCLYRVSQESFRNIAKHAKADDVRVMLGREGDMLKLEIVDSGVGFHPAANHRGLGTHSMKERVRLLNGTLAIDSAPGRGTRVVVQVPLRGEVGGGKWASRE